MRLLALALLALGVLVPALLLGGPDRSAAPAEPAAPRPGAGSSGALAAAPRLAPPGALPDRRAAGACEPSRLCRVVDAESGLPIPAARLRGGATGALREDGLAAADGTVRLPAARGAWEVLAPGYLRRVVDLPPVGPGAATSEIALRRTSPRRVRLAVCDVEGRPVPGARLEVETRGERLVGQADGGGALVLHLEARGDLLRLRGTVDAAGFLPLRFDAVDDGGDELRILSARSGDPAGVLVLERPGRLQGLVLDASGHPVAGAPVELARAGTLPAPEDPCAPRPLETWRATTDPGGGFELGEVPLGRELQARSASGLEVLLR